MQVHYSSKEEEQLYKEAERESIENGFPHGKMLPAFRSGILISPLPLLLLTMLLSPLPRTGLGWVQSRSTQAPPLAVSVKAPGSNCSARWQQASGWLVAPMQI